MNFDRDSTNSDDYYVTALQIFDCCGVDSSGELRVDALMEKFSPNVRTNKAEFTYLKSLLDPEQCNPEINVTKLANTLHKFSQSQKTKVDLDESFNLRCGQTPQDSDSGISDGMQLLEELQCELREKEHLARELRAQLDFTDRQHEETIAALTAERDALRKNLNIVREESSSITQLREDYEEVCERVHASEESLSLASRELDAMRKRNSVLTEQIAMLENDKLTLQELLHKSKEECHRINEMYAARQALLLEENERLNTAHADLAARTQDMEEYVHQLVKEKALLEMELKESLNKFNQTHLRFDRSIDVSYTDDQMLTALDSLNADSRFSQDNRILDEESFIKNLKDDQGRSTNMSLFDEIRLSFCNKSRLNVIEFNLDHSTQTDEGSEIRPYNNRYKVANRFVAVSTQTDEINENKLYSESVKVLSISTQTSDFNNEYKPYVSCIKVVNFSVTIATQTDEVKEIKSYVKKVMVENSMTTGTQTVEVIDLKFRGKGNKVQKSIAIDTQTDLVGHVNIETQTQINEIESYVSNKKDYSEIGTQTIGALITNLSIRKLNRAQIKLQKNQTVETQTDECCNNNNVEQLPCVDCEKSIKYATALETEVTYYKTVLNKMEIECDRLEGLVEDGHTKNDELDSLIQSLNGRIDVLEAACDVTRSIIDNMTPEVCVASCQTECDQVCVSTQADAACVECERRDAVAPQRGIRRLFWESLKCLFQIFAVVCFLCAVCVLYSVSRGARGRCRAHTWPWIDAQDIMDLLLRIEYTADVPM